MKKLLLLVFLWAVLFGACQSDRAVNPTDPLHRTWRLTQTQVGKRAPQVIAVNELITIEFQSTGKIVYNRNGWDGACCVPRRFEQKGQVLELNGSVDQPEYCNYVDLNCNVEYPFVAAGWIIVYVDANRLVLQIADTVLTYQPYS